MSTPPPSSARGLFRFRLATLLAAMLLCISVAGMLRDRQGDAKEQAALDAIAEENIGVRVTRRSERFAAKREETADGNTTNAAGTTSEDEESSFLISILDFVEGDRDPIVTLMIEQIPSDATRRRVLDLPYLERLWIFGNVYPEEGKPYAEPPPLEAIFGGELPALPPATEMPYGPRPLPSGMPLEEDERVELLAKIDAAWKAASLPDGDSWVWYAASDDPARSDIVHATRGDAIFRAERADEPRRGLLFARIHVVGPNRDAVVQRRGETGAWRLEIAARSVDEASIVYVMDDSVLDPRTEILGLLHDEPFVVADAVDHAERLDDGYLLRRKPGTGVRIDGGFGRAESGWMVVGPEPSFVLRRSDVVLTNPFAFDASRQWRTDVIEREAESSLPVRQSTWIWDARNAAGGSDAELAKSRTKRQTRFAFQVDPELPNDLFEPGRQGGDFFAAEPPPPFRWWYATGAASLAAFGAISVANLRGTLGRRRRRRAVSERNDGTGAAEDR